MKAPPADLFIYGVHKDTTKSDIVEDLKDSGIVITESDIEKKTREGHSVDSYRITVKAQDLEKALEPSVWPMRVKVREWIHYPARRKQQDAGNRFGQARKEDGNRFGEGRKDDGKRPGQPSPDVWLTVPGHARTQAVDKPGSVVSKNQFNVLDIEENKEMEVADEMFSSQQA